MAYQVIQQAVNDAGVFGVDSKTYESRTDADTRYHEILMNGAKQRGYKSISAVMLTDHGGFVKSEAYTFEDEGTTKEATDATA